MISFLIKIAQQKLINDIAALPISEEIKNFILNLNDFKLKGQAFNFINKNRDKSLLDVQNFVKELDLETQRKSKLQVSDLSDEWLNVYNNLDNSKLKQHLKFLGRAKKLPEYKDEYKDKINKIRNYLSKDGADEDINAYSLDELYELTEDWEESLRNSLSSSYETIDIVYGPEWINSAFNGFYIVEITTEHDLRLEGKLLNHCVGGPDYFNKVLNNEIKIFSLRDPQGKPHVTIETSYNLFHFKQTFAYSNAQPSSLHQSMINEWKQTIHPEAKIIELSYSDNYEEKIAAAQFMDYSNPTYAKIINEMVETEEDSGNGFYGDETQNDPKDVLQALAANNTLNEQLYEKIYNKCQNNISTIFNLVRNYKIPNNLFRKIYLDTSTNSENDLKIISIIASSFAIGRSENADILEDIIINFINDTKTLTKLLNNSSIKTNIVKNILENLSNEQINLIFKDHKNITSLDTRMVDLLLESSNKYIDDFLLKVLINAGNINERILLKFAKKYNFNKYSSKNKIINVTLKKELSKDNNKILNIFDPDTLAKSSELTSDQIDKLISENFNYFTLKNLAREGNLNDNQIEKILKINDKKITIFLAQNSNIPEKYISYLLNLNDEDINVQLCKNPKLNQEQISFFINQDNEKYNVSLAKNPSLTQEQFYYLFNKNNNKINLMLCSNKNTPAKLLKKFFNESNKKIMLALNENLNERQIKYLFDLHIDDVDKTLAMNPSLPIEYMYYFADLDSPFINDGLSANRNLPYDLCLKLIKYQPIALIKHVNNKQIKQSNKFVRLQKVASKYYQLLKIF